MINSLECFNEWEQHIIKGLVQKCAALVFEKHIPINQAVEKIVNDSNKIITNSKALSKILFEEVTQEHSPHPIICSETVSSQNWWTEYKKSSTSMEYWKRYKEYLLNKPGWSCVSVEDLDRSTDEVLNALANPTLNKSDEKRGLVYGDVQSGKTAHYIGVINKAFCAGYKIIIVLSGMQNSLRSQTQSRIDEEVLGYETSKENKEIQFSVQNSIGVGTILQTTKIPYNLQSLTNRDENGDFNSKNNLGLYSLPYIIVTKKVKSPLVNIINALLSNPIAVTKENSSKIIPAQFPALIIDDEADQASINTKKDPETDVTTINGLIRKLLNLFACKSYVGYTATPFANIFIPHKINHIEYGDDLFPKDFITKSPRPDLYIGAKEFFGLGDDIKIPQMPLIRHIVSGSNFLKKGTKKDDFVGELPKELKIAIKYFIISVAIRNLRGQMNKPNTMLVHIVRFIDQQNQIKFRIKQYKDELFSLIKYNEKSIRLELHQIYENDYVKTNKSLLLEFEKYMKGCILFDFELVWNEIVRLAINNEIKVWSINGKSDDHLLYKNYSGKPFNVIAIGGDKLSRGFTLEGLSISYFTRCSGTMDTLMQMGRWFGYKNGYLDLCRLFTTQELSANFKIISSSVANLLDQFDDMNTIQSNPEHFGLKIMSNPNILISAKNKVRTGIEYKSDFSGNLTQTRLIDSDNETILNNYNAVDVLLSNLDEYRLDLDGHKTYEELTGRKKQAGKTFWFNVNANYIIDFFESYKTSRTSTKSSSQHIADYIKEMNKNNGLLDWTVCLAAVSNEKKEITSYIASKSCWPIGVRGIERNTKNQSTNVNLITRDLHVLRICHELTCLFGRMI